MDLSFSTPQEIVHRVCERLRVERVAQSMTQGELAARAGVSKSTNSNVESGQSVRFEYIVRVAMALGRANELENLFQPAIDSIADVNRYEATATRQRVRKHGKGQGQHA